MYLKRLGKPDHLKTRVFSPILQRKAGGCSRDEFASTTGSLDALFGVGGELLGSYECETLGELAFSEDLEVTLKKA